MRREIRVVTVGRSDYGIYRPLLEALRKHPAVHLQLYVAGMHLSPLHGMTVKEIEGDGFEIDDRIEMLLASNTPQGVSKAIGLGLIGFAQAYARSCPDLLVVLGDRFEMYAAALAALPFKLPVAHIHGGELTFGAIDDSLRHSITKLSHLHFTSTSDYARRVTQLGEEPWRVSVCGALALDNLRSMSLMDRTQLKAEFGIQLPEVFLLATYHPVTLEYERTTEQTQAWLAALERSGLPVLFTQANADPGGYEINQMVEQYVARHPNALLVPNLGIRGYFSVMAIAGAMVGNSSSGLLEAGSFGLPVVNIGTRQAGRLRGANVIDVGYLQQEILAGISQSLEPTFRQLVRSTPNPYDQGGATALIMDRLVETPLDDQLLQKRFFDLGLPSHV